MDVHPTCFVRKHRGVLSKTLPWCGDERQCGAVAHPFPMSSSKHRQNSFGNHRGSGRMESVRERQQGLDIKHLHGVQGFWLSIRNHEKQTTTLGMERHYNHTFYHLSLIHLLWCSSCFGLLTLPHGHQIWDDPSTGANICPRWVVKKAIPLLIILYSSKTALILHYLFVRRFLHCSLKRFSLFRSDSLIPATQNMMSQDGGSKRVRSFYCCVTSWRDLQIHSDNRNSEGQRHRYYSPWHNIDGRFWFKVL